MAHYRISSKGDLTIIMDDPANHEHTYYDTLNEAIIARAEHFKAHIDEPFELFLVYDEHHMRFNAMSRNPANKRYRPVFKKRSCAFIRNASTLLARNFEEVNIPYAFS